MVLASLRGLPYLRSQLERRLGLVLGRAWVERHPLQRLNGLLDIRYLYRRHILEYVELELRRACADDLWRLGVVRLPCLRLRGP